MDNPNRTHTEAVEKVAEAIWAANNRNPVNTHWLHAPDRLREPYRHMAVAAIEAYTAALGLCEERRTLTDGWVQPSRNAMYYAQGMTPPPAVVTHETRLVGPWRTEGGDTSGRT